MPLTVQERSDIEAFLSSFDRFFSALSDERHRIYHLLTFAADINDNVIEDRVLTQAKLRAKTAAGSIVTLLS